MKKWLLFLTILGCCLVVTAAFFYVEIQKIVLTPRTISEQKIILVNSGDSLRKIGQMLVKEGLVDHDWQFVWYAKYYKIYPHIKAGEYLIDQDISLQGLARLLASGKLYQRKITFAEGLTAREIENLLYQNELLTGDFETIREGEFLPETYTFVRGEERQKIIADSLENFGEIIVCEDVEQAIQFANELAPEHLELCVSEPLKYIGRVDNAGSVFLGNWSPEPLGDYYAGPNHVLPTSGTARFFSPLSVESFVKKSSFIYYTCAELRNAKDDIIALAEAEGLTAHANSVKVRFE